MQIFLGKNHAPIRMCPTMSPFILGGTQQNMWYMSVFLSSSYWVSGDSQPVLAMQVEPKIASVPENHLGTLATSLLPPCGPYWCPDVFGQMCVCVCGTVCGQCRPHDVSCVCRTRSKTALASIAVCYQTTPPKIDIITIWRVRFCVSNCRG